MSEVHYSYKIRRRDGSNDILTFGLIADNILAVRIAVQTVQGQQSAKFPKGKQTKKQQVGRFNPIHGNV